MGLAGDGHGGASQSMLGDHSKTENEQLDKISVTLQI